MHKAAYDKAKISSKKLKKNYKTFVQKLLHIQRLIHHTDLKNISCMQNPTRCNNT